MFTRRLMVIFLASLAAHAFAPANARADIYTGLVAGTGAGGYDVVAYFRKARPVKGSTAYTARWAGALWRFASKKNLAAFRANPARYAPAYGGHCAWATAQGYRAKGDPRHWKIIGGRLYFNYNGSIHKRWLKNPAGNIAKANRNGPGLR